MAEALIQVEGLSFTYPGSPTETLQGLSFTVDAGTVFGFLGPSGAGKSTTQKILFRLLSGYRGSARVFGRELTSWDDSFFERIGIAFETPNLYGKLTGRENLRFALALRRGHSRANSFWSAASRVDRSRGESSLETPPLVVRVSDARSPDDRTGETAAPFPDDVIDEAAERLGLQDAIDQQVDNYSKGMATRLSFIRAVLHRPPALFLDEPTSGLDPYWARRVKDWIVELRSQGTAVFLTTHSMELADELCDTVGFLVTGRLLAQDSPTRLKRRYGESAVVIEGTDREGKNVRRKFPYSALTTGPFGDFAEISSVRNRDVSMEDVFLTVTGQRISGETP